MSHVALAFQKTLEDLDVPEEALGDREQQREIGRRAALLATAEMQWRDALGPLRSLATRRRDRWWRARRPGSDRW